MKPLRMFASLGFGSLLLVGPAIAVDNLQSGMTGEQPAAMGSSPAGIDTAGKSQPTPERKRGEVSQTLEEVPQAKEAPHFLTPDPTASEPTLRYGIESQDEMSSKAF